MGTLCQLFALTANLQLESWRLDDSTEQAPDHAHQPNGLELLCAGLPRKLRGLFPLC